MRCQYQKWIFFIVLTFFLNVSCVLAKDLPENRLIVKFKKSQTSKVYDLSVKYQLPILKRLRSDNSFILRVPQGKTAFYAKVLSKFPEIEYVEPDYIITAAELSNDLALIENKQWGLLKIQAASTSESAWNFTKSNPSILVAILDTGIDQDHEDLASKIVANYNCTDTATIDDLYGHGTHVAGIVAGITNNNIGIASVGYNTSLINVKVLDDSGSGYYSWLSDCIRLAVDNGAKVLNMSLSGSSASDTLKQAIDYAWSKGAVLSCAAGNNGRNTRVYPGYYNNCIGVAATDENDQKAYFSNYNRFWVDVAAPGVNIYSTLPNHSNSFSLNYGYLSGTSMATPHVSGLAALIFSVDPSFSNSQVRGFVEENADRIYGTERYWQWGRINAYQSVKKATEQINPSITPTPILQPTSTPVPTVTPTTVLLPTTTPTPTPTEKPIPTLTPTPTITPTITLTPTPTPIQEPTPTPIPWWCRRWSFLCR